MAKFLFSVSTGLVGSKQEEIVEIDDVELDGLSPEKQEKVVQEAFEEWMWNTIQVVWERID
ncbi:hypothetical protein P9G84_22485 [Brevibacillus centrosporus]|uniref:DUF7167 family protein n=1 Tax=Brevibacillus centrosporus TaxID=54910 RepID=UPI000F0A04FA|nr:hypothetical protein [Brevibacillus centrosporus]MEC2131697.1 hypothetical protein [Brevibacillus centrosporus]RNB67344.1 hypothetical protein EDM55_20065 [Brevibacillus centrosporus]GED34007.1 hypothetical protein BCE02nite_51480 [Brevibacillus centrosporus]